jgi:hypothetical protein
MRDEKREMMSSYHHEYVTHYGMGSLSTMNILYYFNRRFNNLRISMSEMLGDFSFELRQFLHTSKKSRVWWLNLEARVEILVLR